VTSCQRREPFRRIASTGRARGARPCSLQARRKRAAMLAASSLQARSLGLPQGGVHRPRDDRPTSPRPDLDLSGSISASPSSDLARSPRLCVAETDRQ